MPMGGHSEGPGWQYNSLKGVQRWANQNGMLVARETCKPQDQGRTLNERNPNSSNIQGGKVPPSVSKREVWEQLERILNSNTFHQAGRLREFLKYVVSVLLEERVEPIKEYHIGVEVFGRKSSFDPRLDPIVRVEASRLRARMKQYLETEGYNDSLVIEIPKGGYMPAIHVSGRFSDRSSKSEMILNESVAASANYIGLALLPFLNLGPTSNTELVCDSMTEELIDMLTDIDGFRVAPRVSVFQFKSQPDDARSIGRRLGVNFLLEGSVRHSEDLLHVKMRIIHVGTGFSRRLGSFDQVVQDLVETQRDICKSIISRLNLYLLSSDEVPYSQPDGALPG